MPKLPNPFRAARKALGLTQQEASKRTGISQSVISDLETDKNTNPTWDVLSKLVGLYRKRPDELLPPAPLPGNHKHTRPPKRMPMQVSA